jgi:hypothetical protein
MFTSSCPAHWNLYQPKVQTLPDGTQIGQFRYGDRYLRLHRLPDLPWHAHDQLIQGQRWHCPMVSMTCS